MKKFLTILLSVCLSIIFVFAVAACDDEPDPGPGPGPAPGPIEPDNKITYTVTVKSAGGGALSDVTVNMYDGLTLVEYTETNASGVATFRLDPKEYTVRLSYLPAGYETPETILKATAANPSVTYYLESHVIDSTVPSGYLYNLGDVMYDFTANTIGNQRFTLSEVLQEKKMVLINFWATWCGPCKIEFPYMMQAYNSEFSFETSEGTWSGNYSDEVAIVALSISDGNSAIAPFVEDMKAQNEIDTTFDWGADSTGQYSHFTRTGKIPLTVIVDRYGVVCDMHDGSLVSVADFTKRFDKYISPDYEQDNHTGNNNPDDPGNFERELPIYTMPESSVLEAAANGTDFNGTYRAITDADAKDAAYYWPWLVGEENGESYIYASNKGRQKYSFAAVYVKFQAQAGDVFTFDYYTSTESECDILYLLLGGAESLEFSGISSAGTGADRWRTCYAYAVKEAGEYEFAFIYNTDEMNASNEIATDDVQLRNFRFTTVEEMNTALTANRESRDILYHCSTNLRNNQWQNHVNAGLNEQDGFWHLLDENGEPNGPLVLGNLMYQKTHWSDMSILEYATYGHCDFTPNGGHNVTDLILEYCNLALNSDYPRYVPVTDELQKALVEMAQYLGSGKENEWLEMCVYFEHFGAGTAPANPIAGLSSKFAHDAHLTGDSTDPADLNEVIVTKNVVPRGFYYKFVPETSGLYRITSYSEEDTICWIFDDATYGSENYLAESSGEGNFDLYLTLEKGKVYYIATTFNDMALYDTFYFGIRLIESNVTRLEYLSYGGYTTTGSDMTGELIIPKAVAGWGWDVNGDAVVLDETGNEVSYIYASLTGETQFFRDPLESVVKGKTEPDYGFIKKNNQEVMLTVESQAQAEEALRNYNFKELLEIDLTYIDLFGQESFDYMCGKIAECLAAGQNSVEISYIVDSFTYIYDINGNNIVLEVESQEQAEQALRDYGFIERYGQESFDYMCKQIRICLASEPPEDGVRFVSLAYFFDFEREFGTETYNYMCGKIEEAKAAEGMYNGYVKVDRQLHQVLEDIMHTLSDMRASNSTNDTANYVVDEWFLLCKYVHEYNA